MELIERYINMADLTSRELDVLRLWNPYEHCLTPREIAEVLGISYEAVKGSLKRARKKFPEGFKALKRDRKSFRGKVVYNRKIKGTRNLKWSNITLMSDYGMVEDVIRDII